MRSITVKLTLAFLFIGLAGAILVAVFANIRTQAAFNQFVQNQGQTTLAQNLVSYYQSNGSWNGIQDNLTPIIGTPQPRGAGGFGHDLNRFILLDTDKIIIYSGFPQDPVGGTVSNQDLQRAVELKSNNATVGWLIFAPAPPTFGPNSPEAGFLAQISSSILYSSLVAALLALALGGLLALTMTRTLRELTEATKEIARGKLGGQVRVRSRDELGALAVSFNKMSTDLAKATQARRQMTADIAHDLRSPLSVLIGYTEALSDGKLPGTPEVYEILHQETRHLNRLVDDLRTLSLADAGELPLNLQPVNPRSILDQSAARFLVTAEKKGVALRVDSSGDLPLLHVDPERMAQIFDNLITNSLRYTPLGGEIILSAQTFDGSVQIQVKDNGSGIAPEDLPHIFDRFYRGDKARLQSGESGLGLAIAKSIVEAHGGMISVESKPGEGAAFKVTFPCQPT